MSKNKHNANLGSEIQRSDERINETGEVFTPAELTSHFLKNFPEDIFKDPKSTFLDNSAGNGNLLLSLKEILLKYHTQDHVLNHMLYAVEMMEDNHKELCERVGVPIDHPHYVCHNALTYDYSFGEPVGLEQFF
jgi:hypothetical protein